MLRTSILVAIAILFTLSIGAPISNARAESAIASVVEAHINAIGGAQAIEKLKTIHRLATVGGTSSFGPVSGKAQSIADLEKKRSFVSMELIGFSTKSGLDGNKGWKWNSITGDTPMPTAEVELNKHAIGPSVLASMYEAYGDDAFSISGQRKYNDSQCVVISIAASPMQIYVDQKTKLLRGYTAPDLIVKLSNFKTIDGVQLPYKQSITIESQNLTLVYDYTQIKVNGKIDETKFASRSKYDNKKAAPPAATEYTGKQVIGFLDKDDDGKISRQEASPEIKASFAYIDTNQDGKIDLKEAQAMMKFEKSRGGKDSPAALPKKRITPKEIIGSMDKNADGKITKQEASEDLKLYFAKFDVNSDGTIDAKEAVVIANFANENQ